MLSCRVFCRAFAQRSASTLESGKSAVQSGVPFTFTPPPEARKRRRLLDDEQSSDKASKQVGFIGYALLTVPLVTFGLGIWQVKRRKWKLALIETVNTRTTSAPIELPEDLSQLADDWEYQGMVLRGTFDHSRELRLDSKPRVDDHDLAQSYFSAGTRRRNNAEIGSQIVTPFRPQGRDVEVLVNRGWVPRDRREPAQRKEGQVEGVVTLVGLPRRKQKKSMLLKNHPDANFYAYRDVDEWARRANTEPIYFEADYETSTPGGPIGGQTLLHFRNEHYSYVITWFGMSLGTAYIWAKRFLRHARLY